MNTIVSRDQFKPIKIGEGLGVNLKWQVVSLVSWLMNTIVSHDQFKPVTFGEDLVVNYNTR